MVTVHGDIQTITITPHDPEVTGSVETTTAVIQMAEPCTGVINVVVPSGATGGLALGKCRVIVDAA